MMANPLFLVSAVGLPIAFVAAVMLWRRSRSISADPWYGAPVVPRVHAFGYEPVAEAPEPLDDGAATDPAPAEPLVLCEKVLFCWDFWVRGKSGLHLEDVFAARDLPTELRAAVARLRQVAEDEPQRGTRASAPAGNADAPYPA